jgi:hypothetical protein
LEDGVGGSELRFLDDELKARVDGERGLDGFAVVADD